MDDPVIKSVRRVFEILELFDQERRPLQVKEVAGSLDYPIVSTHALLKSMYLMGYADFDRKGRAYAPSRSLPSIVEWIPDFLEHERNVLKFARSLNDSTLETINISRRVGARTRVVHGFDCKHPIGVSSTVGTMMPVLHTLTGLTALASLPVDERKAIIESERKLSPESVLDDEIIRSVLNDIARHGMAMRCDLFIEGIGAICLPLRAHNSKEALVIGVTGPSERIERSAEAYSAIIKEAALEFGIELHKSAPWV